MALKDISIQRLSKEAERQTQIMAEVNDGGKVIVSMRVLENRRFTRCKRSTVEVNPCPSESCSGLFSAMFSSICSVALFSFSFLFFFSFFF